MGQERICIAVLDKDTSPSKRMIETSSQTMTHNFQTISALVDTPPAEDVCSIFVDTEHITQSVLAEEIHRVREKWPMSPLIAMTSDRNVDRIVDLFRFGFDEFLLKPLNAEELSIRMNVKRAQLGKEKERPVSIGDISVDPSTRSLRNNANGKVKYLSPIEVSLLSILLGTMDHAISREEVKRKCWGTISVSDNALNRKLFEVRRALTQIESNLTIKTLYGSGYAIQKKKASDEPPQQT